MTTPTTPTPTTTPNPAPLPDYLRVLGGVIGWLLNVAVFLAVAAVPTVLVLGVINYLADTRQPDWAGKHPYWAWAALLFSAAVGCAFSAWVWGVFAPPLPQ